MKRDDSEVGEIERLRARFAKMSEVSRLMTESWELDTVLQEVVDGARSLTDAQCGAVGVFDESGRAGEYITSGSLTIDLSEDDPRGSVLSVPIRHLGESVGSIYVTDKEGGGEFTEEDEETLVMFAAQAAIAIGYERERLARVEMEAERRRLAALVESSPVGVMVVDADTRTFALVNKEAERILGMSPEPGSTLVQYQDVTINRRMDGKEYERHERPIRRALDYGEVVRAEEVMFDLPDGRTVTTLFNATPIYSDDGKIVSAVGVLQDMTPLEEIERLRNEFLAMVSHELRTPLTTIKGCTSIVLGSSDPLDTAEILQYFRMIDEQSDHLRGLVNNLLDMTRIEAGALSVTPKPTDVKSLADEAKAAFLRRGGRNTVDVDLAPGLPLIAADRRRITQVMDNLLSNASKYSSDSSTIRVTGARDGFYVAISVTDEGRGIPSEQLAGLFRKFSRIGESDRQQRVAGEGLGLAICKGIVEAHGGRIWAESDGEGRGTRITFTIPEAAAAPTSNGLGVAPSDQGRILAVDDEPQVLWLLRNILSKHGYKLFGTSSPDEMMRLLEAERPQIVLLDLMLPGVSGFEMMRRVREVSDVPVIFLSGSDQEENVAKALSMGADDYMIKPFSSTELLARVASSLRKRRAEGGRRAYRLGDLAIDYVDRSVTMSGCPVHLSATEYKLIFELSISAGRVLSRDQILQRVWGPGHSGEGDLLRATVKNLRRKLGDSANDPRYIFTEPRIGYCMAKETVPNWQVGVSASPQPSP